MINPDTNGVITAQNHRHVNQRFQILRAYQQVNGVEKYY